MEMHEYLSELTGQIRSKKARQEVAREIQNHIEDQAKAYENEGRTRDEALKEAVRQMGLICTGSTGPVITGWFWAW